MGRPWQRHRGGGWPAGAALGGILLLAAACGGPGQTGGTAPAPGPVARPSIVLIVVDTLRQDHLGCYGYGRDTSPRMDELAASGLRFTRATSQAPWTTPSIGSLLTSQYPTTLGIEDVRSVLDEDLVFLPEMLKEQGYATGAVVSHTFCSSQWGFNQGFDLFDESNILGYAEVCSPGVTARGLEFIDEHRGRPFFLFLHYFDPHNRYIVHPGFEFPGDPAYAGPITPELSYKEIRQQTRSLGPEDIAELVRYYDSEIAFTDHHIGMILDRLRELGLFQDALIVLTADHGEEFKDHGLLGHSHSLFQELVHVPLIIKYPRAEPGVEETPVALADLYPTIMGYLGVPVEHEIVGRSLWPSAPGDGPRRLFTETSRKRQLRGALAGSLKVIRDLEAETLEMYDLEADPHELHNLAGRDTDRFQPLTLSLDQALRALAATRRQGGRTELTDEQVERLRSLGYIGD